MDASSPDTSRTYRTITPNSVSADQFAPAGTRLATTSTPFFRRVSTLLSLGVVASVAAFFVGRQHIPATMSWDVREASTLPSYLGAFNAPGRSFGALFGPEPNRDAMRLAPVTQHTPYRTVMHADAMAGDYSMDERLPSRQCGRGCYCRARLTVVKEGYTVNIKAGYFIASQTSSVRTVPSFIKRNIEQTTTERATKWAAQLLPRVIDEILKANCEVTVEDITGAIEIAQNTAAACPKTDDSRCDAMVSVRTCKLAPPTPTPTPTPTPSPSPKPADTCEPFVRSSPPLPSFDDLKAYCPKLEFYYNRVGTPLPFCVTECRERPGEEHTVYMDFYLQGNGGTNKKDCLSQMLSRAYNNLYSTIPSCHAAPVGYGDEDEGYYLTEIATFSESQDHAGLYSAAKECGTLLYSAFFTKKLDSFQKVVRDSCASA